MRAHVRTLRERLGFEVDASRLWKLLISPKTVDTYRSRIMDELGLSHRSELVRFALEVGLLTRV